MRLFAAINLSNSTKNRVVALQDELRKTSKSGSFTLPENLHLTLVFLGECDAEQYDAAKRAMNAVSFDPIDLTIERVGFFKREGGNIWWAGLRENKLLSNLYQDLTSNLSKEGFKTETRKYSPHITLARKVMSKAAIWSIEPFSEKVYTINLMKSARINGKLTYTSVHRRGKWKKPIVVEPYDPDWPAEFEKIKDYLMPHIGDCIVAIHHVGSTSVPGLSAKPIIDFDIEIADMSMFPVIKERLAVLGYSHEGNYGIEAREVFRPHKPDDFMEYHMYVCPSSSEELKRHLKFRNALRSDPVAVEEYGKLKTELAARHENDIDAYIEGKAEFIKKTLGLRKQTE